VVLFQLPLHPLANPPLGLQDVEFAFDQREQSLKPLCQVVDLEDLLFLFQLDAKVRCNREGERFSLFDLAHRIDQLLRQFVVEFRIFGESGEQRAAQRGDLTVGFVGGHERLDPCQQYCFAVFEMNETHARFAFDQHLHRTVGQFHHLHDLAQTAHTVEVVERGIFMFWLFLSDEHDLPAFLHRQLERFDRLGSADEERDHHLRIDDYVA